MLEVKRAKDGGKKNSSNESELRLSGNCSDWCYNAFLDKRYTRKQCSKCVCDIVYGNEFDERLWVLLARCRGWPWVVKYERRHKFEFILRRVRLFLRLLA